MQDRLDASRDIATRDRRDRVKVKRYLTLAVSKF